MLVMNVLYYLCIKNKLRIEVQSWKSNIFYPEYNLISIDSLSQFVIKNNHLPDIPSEQEVIDNGLDVGDMQALQMQKIEELTLYIIELNKKLENQQKLIQEQQKQIEQMQKTQQ